MAQRTWLYKTPDGIVFEIGLYHGDKSGHLLLYVGNEIIKIDFGVKEAREFSFMLDNELFKMAISCGDEFDYKLYNETKNEEIPLMGKVVRNKRYILLMVLVVFGVILVLTGIVYFVI